MLPIARVFVLHRMIARRGVGAVNMGDICVAVEPLGMEMYTPWAADIAAGIHMRVQTAGLHGEKAHTSGK